MTVRDGELILGGMPLMRQVREALAGLFRERPSIYRDIFQAERARRVPDQLMSALARVGLVVLDGREWRSSYRVTEWRGMFFVTDPFTLALRDRVFPLSLDESLFLAAKVMTRRAARVLDVGTGSGVLAIAAAAAGGRAVATDVNPRALHYAQFNVALNGFRRAVHFTSGSHLAPLVGEQFDLIVANPPVIPAPPQSGFFVHSDGGPLGMDVSAALLARARQHLTPHGSLLILCTSLARRGGRLAIFEGTSLSEALPLALQGRRLYRRPLRPLGLLTQRFAGQRHASAWSSMLDQAEFEALDYFLVVGRPAMCASVVVRDTSVALRTDALTGTWSGRLNRLFMVYRSPLRLSERLGQA